MKKFSLARLIMVLSLLAGLPLSAAAAEMKWGIGVWGDLWAPNDGATTTPQTISGTAFKGPGDPVANSSASFALGLTLNNGSSYTSIASVNDQIKIKAFITPEPQQIGQTADIFVVDRVNLDFKMRTQDGVFIPWDGIVSHLVPFKEDVVLAANMPIDIFAGKLGISADHRFFLGYLSSDGILRYTPNAVKMTITE